MKDWTTASGGKYFIFGGDGDRAFFDVRNDLSISPPDSTPDLLATGSIAFRVERGRHAGRLVVLRPRTMIGIEDGLSEHGVASVIVHLPPEEFDLTDLIANKWAIGMSFVYDSVLDWGARGEVGDGPFFGGPA